MIFVSIWFVLAFAQYKVDHHTHHHARKAFQHKQPLQPDESRTAANNMRLTGLTVTTARQETCYAFVSRGFELAGWQYEVDHHAHHHTWKAFQHKQPLQRG
jgi:hypothetical protein